MERKNILELPILSEGYTKQEEICLAYIFIEELKKRFKLDK